MGLLRHEGTAKQLADHLLMLLMAILEVLLLLSWPAFVCRLRGVKLVLGRCKSVDCQPVRLKLAHHHLLLVNNDRGVRFDAQKYIFSCCGFTTSTISSSASVLQGDAPMHGCRDGHQISLGGQMRRKRGQSPVQGGYRRVVRRRHPADAAALLVVVMGQVRSLGKEVRGLLLVPALVGCIVICDASLGHLRDRHPRRHYL